jgi:hypothetical protein
MNLVSGDQYSKTTTYTFNACSWWRVRIRYDDRDCESAGGADRYTSTWLFVKEDHSLYPHIYRTALMNMVRLLLIIHYHNLHVYRPALLMCHYCYNDGNR